MIYDTVGQTLNKVKIADVPPSIAADGEMFFHSSTKRLMIYFDGAWVDVIPPTDTTVDFSIYLGNLPNHETTIFKTIATKKLKIHPNMVKIVSESEHVSIRFLVDGIAQSQIMPFECEKGACLSIVFEYNDKQTPSDLVISFSAISST